MKLFDIARISSVSLVAVLLSGACSLLPSGGPTQTAQRTSIAASNSATAVAPTVLTTATPRNALPSATHQPTRPLPSSAWPPTGLLDSGSGPVEGWLGTYCWQSLCVDAARIPDKRDLPKVSGDGSSLEFSLSDNATFAQWTISYGTNPNGEMTMLAKGGEAIDPDAVPSATSLLVNSIEFEAPPPGDWAVLVFVQFPNGDLSYAWHVIVD
jgi:hypothetical protein